MWLRADPQVLAERVRADGVDRPLLTDGGTVRDAHPPRRHPRTRRTKPPPTSTVSTDGRDPDAVATLVLEELDRCAA